MIQLFGKHVNFNSEVWGCMEMENADASPRILLKTQVFRATMVP